MMMTLFDDDDDDDYGFKWVSVQLVAARRRTVESNPPPLCCLEITEHGVKMTDRSKVVRLLLLFDLISRLIM